MTHTVPSAQIFFALTFSTLHESADGRAVLPAQGDFFREHSQDACTRIAVPVCAWQLIQRTLVVVPASGISQAQVVHPADMQWYNTRFSVVHPGHVLIAGFTMRNAYDFTDTSEMAYKLNNISLSDSFSSIYRALSRTLYTTALRTPFFISWYCSKECGSIEHHNMTVRARDQHR